jgi:hypothetical protein
MVARIVGTSVSKNAADLFLQPSLFRNYFLIFCPLFFLIALSAVGNFFNSFKFSRLEIQH